MRLRTGRDEGGARRLPGVRQYLIADEYEYNVDPRTHPPTLHRDLLDPLEAGEPVTVQVWELPLTTEQIIANYGGLYAVVRVDADDMVTVIEPASGPLTVPGEEVEQ
jgi:hypothetical protein